MRLRKPTETHRAFVAQEVERILGPELDAPAGALRRVQLMVPGEPTVWAWLTADAETDMAKVVGLNRGSYKGSVMSPSTAIEIHLLPQQTLWAAAQAGTAALSMIIEYTMEA